MENNYVSSRARIVCIPARACQGNRRSLDPADSRPPPICQQHATGPTISGAPSSDRGVMAAEIFTTSARRPCECRSFSLHMEREAHTIQLPLLGSQLQVPRSDDTLTCVATAPRGRGAETRWWGGQHSANAPTRCTGLTPQYLHCTDLATTSPLHLYLPVCSTDVTSQKSGEQSHPVMPSAPSGGLELLPKYQLK